MITLLCLYCGHEFKVYKYSMQSSPRCPVCHDTNFKEIKPYDTDPYGYKTNPAKK